MSTLINLLPDLRQAKLRALRRRQLVTGVALAVWMVCGGIVGVMLVIWTGQSALILTLSNSIKDKTAQLEGMDGLKEAYAAQQHLASLPALYDQRVYLTKFFAALSAADPVGVKIASLNIDSTNTLIVHGTAPSYSEIAKLARALIGSNVIVGEGAAPDNPPYFSDVNISEADATDKTGVSFTISAMVGSGATSGE